MAFQGCERKVVRFSESKRLTWKNALMNDEQRHFLSLLKCPPGRLTAEQTAYVFNCQLHDIPVLVAERLLKPLGNPARNGGKYFATVEVIELSKDKAWLSKMSNAIRQRWLKKNQRGTDLE